MQSRRPFAEELRAGLTALGDSSNREIVFHETVDSTSTDLLRRLRSGSQAGAIVAAAAQEKGRGRMGRSWHSPATGNLYLSLAVEGPEPFERSLPFLPLAAGVAAAEALEQIAGVAPRLKWPNDVNLAGRKLAGILCEAPDLTRRPVIVVVGLGMNIGSRLFPEDLSEIATSLAQIDVSPSSELPAPALLAAHWVASFEHWIDRVRRDDHLAVVRAWRSRAEPFGRRVRINDIEGTTIELADNGHIVIERPSGERVAVAGGVIEFIDKCI